jgi:Fur family transcriptional regulator, peroxide stress response regulator
MPNTERSDKLRKLGLTPTIQRLAVLDCLEKTTKHPTADQVLASVREAFPSVSRGTIYNTLEALARVGLILQITVDPAVARYDADLGPHAHFRCRICSVVYDVVMDKEFNLDEYVECHHIEAVRTYAYGVCETCLAKDKTGSVEAADSAKLSERQKALKATSVTSPTKQVTEKSSSMPSRRNSPSKRGGEFPDARAS